MSADIIPFRPKFSEAFQAAKDAHFLSGITPAEPLPDEELQYMIDHMSSHPNEFGCG